jgi:hypothetical protein
MGVSGREQREWAVFGSGFADVEDRGIVLVAILESLDVGGDVFGGRPEQLARGLRPYSASGLNARALRKSRRHRCDTVSVGCFQARRGYWWHH